MLDEGQHARCVDAWLEGSATGLGPEALLRLFEAALDAVWIRTNTTLGEVTLTVDGDGRANASFFEIGIAHV